MKSLDGRNNVKIYNLSAGKSLPDWLTDRKRRKLVKRDVDIQRRIELIQDFDMPDVSNCVKVSPDGQYILATGIYKPRVKCFEVSALSLKFERCFDAEVIDFEILSEDYSKVVFLQEDRFIEFHNQAGRWYRTRIPKFGRDIAYHYPSCDLYIGSSGSEIYRLNLHEGKFLNSIHTSSPSVNKCTFNPVHYLFTCGTEDGIVEAWDPRSRLRVGVLDCALHMINENVQFPTYKSAKELGITSLCFSDALTLGVGTQTGQILLYDIRSNKPLLVKDHMDGFPILDIEFHASTGKVLSLSANALKIWNKADGEPHTSIETDVKFNDLCSIPNSGMIFLATEDPKMQIHFLPSLGPAPKWCSHLDALIEELEEEEVAPAYDDYKFVTEAELRQLGLDNLIGTNILKAVMHGYYLDIRLYHKAKDASNMLDTKSLLKSKIKQKLSEQNERKIITKDKIHKSVPDVNKESFLKLKEVAQKTVVDTRSAVAADLLQDPRFEAFFSKNEFNLDKNSETYSLVQPLVGRTDKFRQFDDSDDDMSETKEIEENVEAASSSDEDSIVSNDLEEVVEKEVVVRTKKSKKKRRPKEPEEAEDADPTSNPVPKLVSKDNYEEFQEDWDEINRLSLAERLQKESEEKDDDIVNESSYGSRQMTFKLDTTKKFEKLRQQQQDHHQERKRMVRSAKKLTGKKRMNKPFM